MNFHCCYKPHSKSPIPTFSKVKGERTTLVNFRIMQFLKTLFLKKITLLESI